MSKQKIEELISNGYDSKTKEYHGFGESEIDRIKDFMIEQQELIDLLRSKLSKLRGGV